MQKIRTSSVEPSGMLRGVFCRTGVLSPLAEKCEARSTVFKCELSPAIPGR